MIMPTHTQFIDALNAVDPLLALDELYGAVYGDNYGAWEGGDEDRTIGAYIVIGTELNTDIRIGQGGRGQWVTRDVNGATLVQGGPRVAQQLAQALPSLEAVAARVAEENA